MTEYGTSSPTRMVNHDLGEVRMLSTMSARKAMSSKEVAVGLRGLKGRQTVVLYPKKSIELTLSEGPMIGTRIITLIPSSDNEKTTTRVNVSWDVKLSDNIPLLFRGIVRERIAEATEEALDRIARAVQ